MEKTLVNININVKIRIKNVDMFSLVNSRHMDSKLVLANDEATHEILKKDNLLETHVITDFTTQAMPFG